MTNKSHETELRNARLIYEVQYPDYEEFYLQGFEEGHLEIADTANPYEIDTKAYEMWEQGWWDAFYGNEPMFDYDGNVHYEAPEFSNTTASEKTITKLSKFGFFGELVFGILFGSVIASICYDLVT